MISLRKPAFVLSLIVAACVAHAQPNADYPAKTLESYPWSETSEFVRVPKGLLDQITISPVTMTNTETREFVLKDEFVTTFKLTPVEVERITASLADALHQYRLEEGKRLVPTEEEMNVAPPQRPGPAAVEKFSFRLVPFPEEARAIRKKLEHAVLTTLGEERAKFFWQSRLMLESEMSTFSQEFPVPAGMVRTTTFTFQLTDANPGPLIDMYKSTMTRRVDGRPGGGGGTSGFTYGAPLDQYAPEPMKPVLARWRKAIADGSVGSKAAVDAKVRQVDDSKNRVPQIVPSAAVAQTAATPSPQSEPSTPNAERWDDKAPFVDLPKNILKSLQIPGLTEDGEISPEAAALFGLTAPERKSVRELYHAMKARFEQIERAHFQRTEAGKNNFVLRPFAEKSAAIQAEWTEKLKEPVGRNRGESLDRSIRQPLTMFQLMRRGTPREGERFRSLGDRGPDWLHRGTAEIQVDISDGPIGRDGQPTLRIEYRSQGEGGGRGSWSGRRDQIPERWRHLLTPDMLGVPLTF